MTIQAIGRAIDLGRSSELITVFGAASVTITMFALTPISTHVIVAEIDPIAVSALRVVVPLPIIGALLMACRLPPPLGRGEWPLFLLVALPGFLGFPILFSLGVRSTSTTHAALGLAAVPLFTSLIGMRLDRAKPAPRWIVGAFIAMAGEAMLILTKDSGLQTTSSLAGDALVLAGALSASVGFVAGGFLAARTDAWTATFWPIALAGLIQIPLLIAHARTIPWTSLSTAGWVAIVQLSLGITVAGYACWFYALGRGGVARVAPLQFLQPILSVVFAALLLGEPLTARLTGAAAVILVGLSIARRYASPARR